MLRREFGIDLEPKVSESVWCYNLDPVDALEDLVESARSVELADA